MKIICNENSVSVNNFLLENPCSFSSVLSVVTFMSQSWVVVIEITVPTKQNIFAICPVIEKV